LTPKESPKKHQEAPRKSKKITKKAPKSTKQQTVKQSNKLKTNRFKQERKLTGTISYAEDSSWDSGSLTGADGGASPIGLPQYSANSTGSQKYPDLALY
jgi:hypothetical protein